MLIRYADGSSIEGVIHGLEGATLKTAVAGANTAAQFTLVQNEWVSESGLAVTFEFSPQTVPDLLDMMLVMATSGAGQCAAGGDCVLRRTTDAIGGKPN